MQKDLLKNFIQENACFIYEYINQEVLKNIAVMDPDFFVKVIKEIFEENDEINLENTNMFPYVLFTLFSQRGIIAYTSLRPQTLNFKQIDNEASTYYNYARFSIQENDLVIELMQAKIGGMPIDADIVKFAKKIAIQTTGLEKFINENQELKATPQNQKIEKAIALLF